MKIGIIGQGFVGSAVREGLKNFYEIMAYDIDSTLSKNSHSEITSCADIIFVCLPTPMKKSGQCDTRILESAIQKIDDECAFYNTFPIIVIKSTIPPGTTERINRSTRVDVCFSPEFLTEANSFEDFKNQTRIIIGGPRPSTGKIKQMFRKAFPTIPIIKTGSNTAESVKYFINCFLSTKVTFANQMYDICAASGVDYDKVCEYALFDKRIGNSHLAVPGPDGDRGFGGHCFPKDLAAMIFFGTERDVNVSLLENVSFSNGRYRKNKDWITMKGRAVSED